MEKLNMLPVMPIGHIDVNGHSLSFTLLILKS